MTKSNIILVIIGLIIILFAVFSPSIIANIHSMTWRIVIGLFECFSFVSSIYKVVVKK